MNSIEKKDLIKAIKEGLASKKIMKEKSINYLLMKISDLGFSDKLIKAIK